MGLGLTVSSLVCEKLKGRIFLDWTIPGKGSKFIAYIPVTIVKEAPSIENLEYFNISVQQEDPTLIRSKKKVPKSTFSKDNILLS